MSTAVGFVGKLPAHGDFVRRGLAPAVAATLDAWLQREFGRASDPAAAMRALPPLRFASTALADGQLALGAMIPSGDSVGRDYVAVAVRLSPHAAIDLPEPLPDAWDDWCARAEALLTAARARYWTADATQAALEAADRASAATLTPAVPFAVRPMPEPATATWRPSLHGGERTAVRSAGLVAGDAFDRLVSADETAR